MGVLFWWKAGGEGEPGLPLLENPFHGKDGVLMNWF